MNDGRGHLAFLKRICNDNRLLCYKAFAVNPNVPALLLTPRAHSQKEGLGLDKCIETAKARMARYQVRAVRHAPQCRRFAPHAPRPLRPQVTPNMLIVPPELLLYIATSSEEKYVYNVAGPAGPAKFEAGVAGYEARAFRGCGVVTSSPFEISDDADSLQMLQRNTQVGEFYRMRAPSIDWTPADKTKAAAENAKHKNYMDIIIYNEESDMHVHISFEEALKATCVFNSDKSLAVAENPFKAKDGSALDYDTLVNNNKNGVWMPVSLVIARPFIEHRMMSAVLAVAGADTGVTLFGPADMQISANTSVKTIEGHVSLRCRCPALPSRLFSHSPSSANSTLVTRSRSSRSRRT